MPELPEVETICEGLRKDNEINPSILQRQIINAVIYWPRSIQTPAIEEFISKVSGQTVRKIHRRGKFILINLDNHVLAIHLRMSGDLIYKYKDEGHTTHERVEFVFLDGDRLVFKDTRKFGRIWLVNDEKEVTGNLGPEPFDNNLTDQIFFQMLHNSNRKIKPLLLDQNFISGLGNIYSDESLFLAGIHPLKKANEIDLAKARLLLGSIRNVLHDGIKHHGSSIDWAYRGGDFQNYFRVYHRTDLPCVICATNIVRCIVGQRSTHFCPNCQNLSD